MCYFAMDLGWKRVPMLLILLIFWKHAFGQKGWSYHDVPPYQKWHDHRIASPRGAQSSGFETPVTGSIPFEEVASNVLAGETLNPSRSRSSYSRQYVKGGISGSHASKSRTQSAPSSSVSASLVLPQNLASLYSNPSLLQLQGSFSPSVQDIANQSGLQLGETSSPLSAQSSSSTGSSASSLSEFDASQGSSRPQLAGSSSQLVSTDGVSGLLPQSQSTASQISGSSMNTKLAASPLFVSQSTSSSTGSSGSSLNEFIGSSQPQLVGSSSQLVSTDGVSGLLPQSQSTASQISGSSMNTELAASPLFVSQSTSSSTGSSASSLSEFDTSQGSSQPQLVGSSSQLVSTDGVSGLLPQSQSTASHISGSSMNTKLAASPLFVSQSASSSTGSSASSLSEFDTSQGSPRPQLVGSSSQPVSTDGVSGLLPQSQSTASQISGSFMNTDLAASPLSVSQSTSSSPGSSASSLSGFTDASQGSSQPQLAGSSSQPFSTDGVSGLLPQSQNTASQISGSSMNTDLAASPLSVSQSTSGQSSYSQYTSGSQRTVDTQLVASHQYVPKLESSYGSSFQPQGASSQYTPNFSLGAGVPVPSQYYPATLSGSSQSLSQSSQKWQPSTSRTQVFQPSTPAVFQGFQTSGTLQSVSQYPSRFVSQSNTPSQGSKSPSSFSTLTSAASPGQFFSSVYTSSSPSRVDAQLAGSSRSVPMQAGSTSPDGSSLQLQGTSSQYAPDSLVAKVPPYKPAAPSGSSSLSQPSQLQSPTSRWSQGFQASGTVASQSGSVAQGSTSPSRFSTLTSAASPGQSFSSVYTSSSPSRVDAQLASRYVPMQAGSTSTDVSSLQRQGTSTHYAPASLVAKVPPYKPADPSGSSSLSQPSQLQSPTSRWSQGFQASGTVASQSGAQGSMFPSSFSTLTSPASPGQSFSNVYTSSSPSRVDAQLAGSSRYMPLQAGSTSTDGSSLQLQGTSSQYAPASLVAKVPPYKPAAPSGSSSLSQPSQLQSPASRWSQGFQASGTVASQSGSVAQGSTSPSRFSTLTSAASPGQSFSSVYTSSSPSRLDAQLAGSSRYVPMQAGSTSTDGSSLQRQGTSTQYAPASLVAKVPPYKPAAPSGSSSLSQPSQLQSPTSRWSQGFQASGTVASQSGSLAQGSTSPSSFSTLTSAASPGQSFSNVYTSSSLNRADAQLPGSSRYMPMQAGSTSTDGSSLQLQGTSSQYAPASLVAKVPPYKPAAPSGSSSLSQPSQLQSPTSRWSQGFQASGTVASQSGAQGSMFPSSFSTLTSPASPGQSFSNVYTSSSLNRADAQLPGSSRYMPMQAGSTSTDGSSLQLQGTSSQYAPASLVAKVPPYKPAAQSGSFSLSQLSQLQPPTSRWSQGFQASGTVASQSGSLAQGSMSPSGFSTLTSAASPGQSFSNVYTSSSLNRADAQLPGSSRYMPMQAGSTSTDGSSLQLQGTSSQYAPASLVAKVPPYKPAAQSGSFSLSQPSQLQPPTSRWSQGFQASGTAASQSSFPSQGSRSPGRSSTLVSEASPGNFFSTRDESGKYSSLSSQSQSASSQYNSVDSSTYGQKPSKSSSLRRYHQSVKG